MKKCIFVLYLFILYGCNNLNLDCVQSTSEIEKSEKYMSKIKSVSCENLLSDDMENLPGSQRNNLFNDQHLKFAADNYARKLKVLLVNSTAVTDKGLIYALNRFTSIEVLDMSNVEITDQTLIVLTNKNYKTLRNIKFTDYLTRKGIKSLYRCKNLENVNIEFFSASQEVELLVSVRKLFDENPKIKHINDMATAFDSDMIDALIEDARKTQKRFLKQN